MERIKVLFAIGIFAILLSHASAENLKPYQIGSSTVDVNLSNDLKITGDNPDVKWMRLEINIPLNDQNQIVSVTSNQEYNVNSNENESLLVLEWQNPQERVIHYNVNIRVERNSFITPILSNQRGYNPGYLKTGELTRCNAEIKSKAEELSRGADNDLVIIGRIAHWVNKNVEYDINLSGKIKPDQWVFENKRGTCVEFSNLFISMCRSLGIPARSVSGLSYDGKSWEPHSWAEVFIGDAWIPVDPTNNQIGFVDGAHIVYSRALENAEIRYGLRWQGSDISNVSGSEPRREMEFIETRPPPELIDIYIDFNPDNQEITKGGVNITANLKSLSNSHIVGPIRIIAPTSVIVDEKEKLFYIGPGEKSNVTWAAKLENISFGYIYTYPIAVRSLFPYDRSEKELTVKPAPAGVSIGDMSFLRTDYGIGINVELNNMGSESMDVTVKTCLWESPINNGCKESIVYLKGNAAGTESFEFPVPCVNHTSEYTSEITVISGGEVLDKKKTVVKVGRCNECEIDLILWKTKFIAKECWVYKLTIYFIFVVLLSIILYYYHLHNYQRS